MEFSLIFTNYNRLSRIREIRVGSWPDSVVVGRVALLRDWCVERQSAHDRCL